MKVLVYHPTGNQNVRALLRGLSRHDMLQSFHTTVAVFEKAWYYNLLKSKLERIKRRTYDDSIRNLTFTYPFEELLMFGGFHKFFGKKLNPNNIDLLLAKKVVNYIKKHYQEIDVVYCYPGHSYLVMEEAHKYGIPCIYELTIAYYKDIQIINHKEKINNSKWYDAITLAKESDAWSKGIDKELSMADDVVCASTYIRGTLLRYKIREEKDIHVIPYGFPATCKKEYHTTTPLKLLYVGNLTQSKGLSYLFKAIDEIGNEKIELSLIGSGILSSDKYKHILDKYNYLGTMSHDNVLKVMHEADILMFPTLSDGFGMVVTESMAMGTPVLATVNSCGRDIIYNNKNGWLVNIQDFEAIKDCIEEVLQMPSIIKSCGKAALASAKLRPWNVYEDEITELIRNFKTEE